MTKDLAVILAIGSMVMCFPIALQMRWGGIKPWKSVVVSGALILTGLYGSQIWYFVENFSFGGRSFYGAVFFAPLVFLLIARLVNMPYGAALDYVAPTGCLMLAAVKIQCFRDHCCQGMVLYINEDHIYVRFPSQIVEAVAFLVIAFVLFRLAYDPKNQKTIFLWFLAIYGAARFGLDFLRDVQAPYALGLSAGSFWSLCSFAIGTVLLVFIKHRRKSSV